MSEKPEEKVESVAEESQPKEDVPSEPVEEKVEEAAEESAEPVTEQLDEASEEKSEDAEPAEAEEEASEEAPVAKESEDAAPEAEVEPESKEEPEAASDEVEPDGEKDTEVLAESLTVIKQVREELSNAYAQHKKQSKEIENLNGKVTELAQGKYNAEKTVESLSKELKAYKARDAELEQATYTKRLETLSADFEKLGQKKTLEELSAMDKSVIAEFEKITAAALDVKQTETLSTPVTVPSQSMGAPKAVPAQRKSIENLSMKEFAEAALNVLQKREHSSGLDEMRL
jgi:hypothetical protein